MVPPRMLDIHVVDRSGPVEMKIHYFGLLSRRGIRSRYPVLLMPIRLAVIQHEGGVHQRVLLVVRCLLGLS